MTREELFEIWAPHDSLWTPWAKAVLFANFREVAGAIPAADGRFELNLRIAPKTSVILDMPGPAGVWAALELASCGFRPVPLYNAIPAPRGGLHKTRFEAVNVQQILDALSAGTERLLQTRLRIDSPPAFLLDSLRRGNGILRKYELAESSAEIRSLSGGDFDNRSICFPTDFPSAAFMREHGIDRAMVIQVSESQPQEDLNEILARWYAGGLEIHRAAIGGSPVIDVIKPSPHSSLRRIWRRMLGKFRRNSLGGFGSPLPSCDKYGVGG